MTTFLEFIQQYWHICVLIIFSTLAFSMLVALLYHFFIYKPKSFKETISNTKSVLFSASITISPANPDQGQVEIYYLYDQKHENESLTLSEFNYRFDKNNLDKLEKWYKKIMKLNDINRTRRIELVMYRGDQKGVYLVELEKYDLENNCFHLLFRDITASIKVFRRLNKNIISDIGEFSKKATEILKSCDVHSNNYIAAFKYRENKYTQNELPKDLVKILEENIYDNIQQLKLDSELICFSEDGTVLLFSANIANEKKYKKHIKNILSKSSGLYHLIQDKFRYTINLIVGYKKVSSLTSFSENDIVQAEMAANQIMQKGHFADRIQLFDGNLKKDFENMNARNQIFEQIVDQKLFQVNFIPVINKSDKCVSGFFVKTNLKKELSMTIDEFMNFVKTKDKGKDFYTILLEKINDGIDVKSCAVYISLPYENIGKVTDVCVSFPELVKPTFVFCLEFSSTTMQNSDLITIEKTMESFKKKCNKIKFGITYNNLTTVYLNSKIYSKVSTIIFDAALVSSLLDSYEMATLIDIYANLAFSYSQDIIGLSIKSLELYELLNHYGITKFGGSYFDSHIENGKIVDKTIISKLEEIENRPY